MSTTEQGTEIETKVRDLLAAHHSMFLAVCADDVPWASGVHFAETDLFTIVLVLEESGRTLSAIRQNPTVAMVVSSGAPYDPFLQARATVTVLEGDPAAEAIRVLVAKVPAVEAFLTYPHHTVRLTVDSWRVTDVANGWIPGRVLSNDAVPAVA